MLVKSKLYDNAIRCTHKVYYGFKKRIFYYITHCGHIGIGISNTIVLYFSVRGPNIITTTYPLIEKQLNCWWSIKSNQEASNFILLENQSSIVLPVPLNTM